MRKPLKLFALIAGIVCGVCSLPALVNDYLLVTRLPTTIHPTDFSITREIWSYVIWQDPEFFFPLCAAALLLAVAALSFVVGDPTTQEA